MRRPFRPASKTAHHLINAPGTTPCISKSVTVIRRMTSTYPDVNLCPWRRRKGGASRAEDGTPYDGEQ